MLIWRAAVVSSLPYTMKSRIDFKMSNIRNQCDYKSQLLLTHQCHCVDMKISQICQFADLLIDYWKNSWHIGHCKNAHEDNQMQKCSPGQSNCSLHRSRGGLSEELPGECKLFLLDMKLPFLLFGFLELSGDVVTTPLLPSSPPSDLSDPLDDLPLSCVPWSLLFSIIPFPCSSYPRFLTLGEILLRWLLDEALLSLLDLLSCCGCSVVGKLKLPELTFSIESDCWPSSAEKRWGFSSRYFISSSRIAATLLKICTTMVIDWCIRLLPPFCRLSYMHCCGHWLVHYLVATLFKMCTAMVID